MKKSIAFLLAAFVTLTVFAQKDDQTMPNMVLKDMNGKPKNMSDYSKTGKITIVSFWATWCSPCKKELNNINDVYDDWKNKYNLELVAVCTDNARNTQKVKPYVDGQGWEFDVVMDVNQEFQRALNIVQIPHTFLLDQNGKVVYQHSGYVEGDEFALEEKIKSLMAGK
ncbi:MAG: TlpA family protein disulfide reductase [Bacteroidia bacterium]|nr:TlpA family protein disulfide reductase [Bacteroidia bacterium]MCF8425328.1 TlpA family protein disulfide reductase [Bacteroidia bacterium]MCF8446095.1 TlpA family protein disulfide reductase [Bacteroidia bacterium]